MTDPDAGEHDGTDAQIGTNVARLRESRGGISQASLAEQMRARGWRWSQATVWSVEKGDRPLRLAEAVSLADIFDVSVLDLSATTEAQAIRTLRRGVDTALDRAGSAIEEVYTEWLHLDLFLLVQETLARHDGGPISDMRREIHERYDAHVLSQRLRDRVDEEARTASEWRRPKLLESLEDLLSSGSADINVAELIAGIGRREPHGEHPEAP